MPYNRASDTPDDSPPTSPPRTGSPSAVDSRRRDSQFYDLAAALAGALTPGDVVSAAVRHTAAAFGAVGTVVALRPDAESNFLEIIAAADMPEEAFKEWHRFPMSAPAPLAQVARTGQAIFLESPEAWESQFPEIARSARAAGHQANAVIPLCIGGHMMGAMGIAFAEPRSFTAHDRELASTIAHQCALAIERAARYERERAARARAEEISVELANQTHELEHASRAKTQFLATMSHELRTPLNAIAGYAELLLMELYGPVTRAQADAIARIQRSERHLLGLINDVLNFAKIDTGNVTFTANDVALSATLDFVGDLVAPQLRSKQLRYVVSPPDDGLQVRGDPERIGQIILNLLSNAIKFTDSGGTISIWCEVDDNTGFTHVRVRDTGQGVPPDQLQHIFDPFVQLDRRLNHPTEGTGLGLAISRDLARAMGGELTVESTLGAGSTFTLRLPTSQAKSGAG